jgi:hypothetical protein
VKGIYVVSNIKGVQSRKKTTREFVDFDTSINTLVLKVIPPHPHSEVMALELCFSNSSFYNLALKLLDSFTFIPKML